MKYVFGPVPSRRLGLSLGIGFEAIGAALQATTLKPNDLLAWTAAWSAPSSSG